MSGDKSCITQHPVIAMFLVTSPIVINASTRSLLAVETMHAIVQWLANLNIKRNITSMFVNKKHRYSRKKTKWDAYVMQSAFLFLFFNQELLTLCNALFLRETITFIRVNSYNPFFCANENH